jgi:hypothetical protein
MISDLAKMLGGNAASLNGSSVSKKLQATNVLPVPPAAARQAALSCSITEQLVLTNNAPTSSVTMSVTVRLFPIIYLYIY